MTIAELPLLVQKQLFHFLHQKYPPMPFTPYFYPMNLEELREYCLAKKGVEEGMPFGDTTLVMKVMGKIFALLPLEAEIQTINLKCDPARAIELREAYPDSIQPGYHMNKAHWNTVSSELGLPKKLLQEMIDHSYELIVASLPKKVRLEWEQL